MDAGEILEGLERALELERELGVKVVEIDRSLLVFPPPDAAPAAAVAAAEAPAVAAAQVQSARSAFSSAHAPRESPQPTSGGPSSDLVVVAASPAEMQGIAGELLLKMLGAIGRDLGSAPVEVAGPDLAQRVMARNPKVVVMLGREACRALLPSQRVGKGEWIAFLDSDDLWVPEKLEKMVAFAKENNYSFVYHDYEKIDENGVPLNIYVTGPKVVTKRKMYHYGYPGCLTFMYSAKAHGLIQIEDIKKNNDYAILLKLCKASNCYLLPENLAKYRIRKKSISHDKLSKKLKSHYDLFHICDKKPAVIAFWCACWNMWYGVWKKRRFERPITR